MRATRSVIAAALTSLIVQPALAASTAGDTATTFLKALVVCRDRRAYEIDIDAGKVIRTSGELGREIGSPEVLAWGTEDKVYLGCSMDRGQMEYVSLVEIDIGSLAVTRQVGPWTDPSGEEIEPGEIYDLRGFPKQKRLLVMCQGFAARGMLLVDTESGDLLGKVPRTLRWHGWIDVSQERVRAVQRNHDSLSVSVFTLATGEESTMVNVSWEVLRERLGPGPEEALKGLRILPWDPHRHAVVIWAVPGRPEPLEKSFEGMFGGGEAAFQPHSVVDREGDRILVPVVAMAEQKSYIVVLRGSDGAVLHAIEVGPGPTNPILLRSPQQ